MAELNRDILKKISHLARIECTDEELDILYDRIKKVLDYIELLSVVDTDNVPPCNHIIESFSCPLRDDVQEETLSKETFLANAPSHVGGMIKVPPVIKDKYAP